METAARVSESAGGLGRDPRSVAAIVYDGLCLFEYSIVVELFGLSRPEIENWYRFETFSIDRAPLRATGGVTVEASVDRSALDRAGTIVVPGWRDLEETPPSDLLDELRAAHADGARIASVCSGVFVLAAAGLLDGLRATTHWRYAERLASRYPKIEVDSGVLYIDEGRVLTSAGSAAGIDLGLHLVRLDFGSEVANHVARRLVVAPHRDGGQAQFLERPVAVEEDASFAALLDSVRATLDGEHTIASMAAGIHVSSRSLIRLFRRSLDTTPHEWLTQERVRLAQELLESAEGGVEQVAARSGFGSAQLLRHHFRRRVGLSPTAYRRRFSKCDSS